MSHTFNVQYLTNEQGVKTAVQIPFKEWNILLKDYAKLQQFVALKKEMKQGFLDLINIEKGKLKEITLSAFLDEN
jgi:hypothetical protein